MIDPVQTLSEAITQVTEHIPNLFALGANALLATFIGWLRGLNFITHTPSNLVNVLSNMIGLNEIVPLLDALTGTAFLFAAVSYAGHYIFGWPGIAQSLQRIGIGVLLVKISQQLTDWSLAAFDGLTQGIAASLPDFPPLDTTDALVIVILMAFWAILFARLAFIAGKRIAWLALLKPLAGLAFIAYLHHKSSWITSMWTQLWVGWLIGQLFLILAVALSVLMVKIGGFGGYVLSCAALMVAHDAVQILTPKSGPPLISIGPIKI